MKGIERTGFGCFFIMAIPFRKRRCFGVQMWSKKLLMFIAPGLSGEIVFNSRS